jgi:hypothetical protein
MKDPLARSQPCRWCLIYRWSAIVSTVAAIGYWLAHAR